MGVKSVLLAALVTLALAAPASAATTNNACQDSSDAQYRDVPVTLDLGVPGGEVVPGDVVRTSAGTVDVALPGPLEVTLAVRATNTKERVQVVGPLSAPFVVPELTWTAVGGDITVAEERVTVATGSVVLDCHPGQAAGASFVAAPAVPVGTIAGPKNLMCLRSAAQELSPLQASLAVAGAGAFTPGAPYVLPPVVTTPGAQVTLLGEGTVEGVQTVAAGAPSTWTPAGTGPLTFTLAPRLGSFVLGELRCAPGAIRVVDAGVPFGEPARYALDANLDRPVLAVVSAGPPVVVYPPPPPYVAPPRPVVKAPAGSVNSTRLTSRRAKLDLRIRCPSGAATCRGTVKVVSVSKLRLGGKRARKVTLTKRFSYAVGPGRLRTVTLSLSKDGIAALKRKPTLAARVTLATREGVKSSRRVTVVRR